METDGRIDGFNERCTINKQLFATVHIALNAVVVVAIEHRQVNTDELNQSIQFKSIYIVHILLLYPGVE